MKITSDQTQAPSVDSSNLAIKPSKSEHASKSPDIAGSAGTASAAAGTVPPVQRATDVTFRRDSNGRVYYLVSDASSGQEILEVPPKTVREVGQGIEDYLKKEQSKTNSHVEVKA
jgi:hypothetical protein